MGLSLSRVAGSLFGIGITSALFHALGTTLDCIERFIRWHKGFAKTHAASFSKNALNSPLGAALFVFK